MTNRRRRVAGPRVTATNDGRVGTLPGLGQVEQLVLRGDGLTTTSLEILTGAAISTRVRAHWHLPLHAELPSMQAATDQTVTNQAVTDQYTGMPSADPGRYAHLGFKVLRAEIGEELMIRELDLVGDGREVLACASVVAVLGVLPLSIAHLLGTTDQPIGRLLAAQQVQVQRELTKWGLSPAGPLAERLGVEPATPVPARSYVMRAVSSGRPLALIEEWFSPTVFGRPTAGGRRVRPRWTRGTG